MAGGTGETQGQELPREQPADPWNCEPSVELPSRGMSRLTLKHPALARYSNCPATCGRMINDKQLLFLSR